MSKKDREGPSKRQEFREKRRRAELRNRWIVIGAITIIAILIVGTFAYYELQPVAAIQKADARTRPSVSRNSTGNPNAPVKLVEFSDYQCPFCKQFWTDTEAQIVDTYVKTGKVLFTYRSAGNWVSDHANSANGGNDIESSDAARAAYCAADQNKFWEMHDALFANVLGEADGTSFPASRLQTIAQKVGLNMNAFNSCFSSQKYLDQVNQDGKDAQAANIQGTPWFVLSYTVNGQTQTSSIDGAQPFNIFQQDIDKALAAAGAK